MKTEHVGELSLFEMDAQTAERLPARETMSARRRRGPRGFALASAANVALVSQDATAAAVADRGAAVAVAVNVAVVNQQAVAVAIAGN